MSEVLKIDRYETHGDYFECTDALGEKRRVDLLTSGCLAEGTQPQDIVGKQVSVEYTHPFLEMAEGVELVGS